MKNIKIQKVKGLKKEKRIIGLMKWKPNKEYNKYNNKYNYKKEYNRKDYKYFKISKNNSRKRDLHGNRNRKVEISKMSKIKLKA